MSTQSICFAGLSREEESEVLARFRQANGAVGNRWTLAPEVEADVVVIDMDSMYGQMSLMKAIGAGKAVVALTAGSHTDTDFVLHRPVTGEGMAALLAELSAAAAATPAEPAPAASPDPVAATPAPPSAPAASSERPEIPAPPADPAPAPAADPHLADYLRAGALPGPVRLQRPGAPDLVLDPGSQTYLGGSALKPLLPYCSAPVPAGDLQPVDPAELPSLAGKLGAGQPWARLLWLCALAGGNGALLPGFGPNDKFKLLKWPQTEREFPKHFRIATVMMKGPAVLTDIAELSGAALPEVIDFVNASLVAGVAVPEGATASAAEAAKGGLLGRFRR